MNEENMRDRFAMAALTGILGSWNHDEDSTLPDYREATLYAYLYANQMLAVRMLSKEALDAEASDPDDDGDERHPDEDE